MRGLHRRGFSPGYRNIPFTSTAIFLILVMVALGPDSVGGNVRRVGSRPAARPGFCQLEQSLFEHCFQCGRLSDDIRIYLECCNKFQNILDFCESMLN